MRNLTAFTIVLIFILFAAASAPAATPASKWAKYSGGKIHYYDIGPKQKEAIILVHGWACAADFWQASFDGFPNRRVIAVDLPGHGQSDKPRTNYSMEYFARAIEAVMLEAKINRAVLVGHSMGTPVIRQFYRLFPAKTLALVIVDGALKPFASRAAMESFIKPLRDDFQKNGPAMIDSLVRPMQNEAMKTMVRKTMLSTPGYVAGSAMEGMADDAIWTNDQINVPVLAIMSGSGPWPADNAQIYKKIAPMSEYVVWQGVSHFLMMERPREFDDAVNAFLAKNGLLDNRSSK